MKNNFKSNRKAFTLVELLIVIAIIGILFVVLVSKVDFATDKASTTGVQTDFRSFQIAFETVSREKAGFNTLGWDTGDKTDNALITGYTYENADKDGGDRVRNSYDKGDMNLNGICEDGETWTGQKLYTETWTGIYTLDNPADADDMSAYIALEKAINKNLDPALQISIDPENKTIYMANGYQDPWKTEYHGFYLSNAAVDGKDRGAIVMYSDGPNKVFGSEQIIANGAVTVTVKNGGINGQDDMSIVTCYTYINGYGEVATMTEGFSNNQVLSGNNNGGGSTITQPVGLASGLYDEDGNLIMTWQQLVDEGLIEVNGTEAGAAYDPIADVGTRVDELRGKLVIDKSITSLRDCAFIDYRYLTKIVLHDGITYIGSRFLQASGVKIVNIPENATLGSMAFYFATELTTVKLPNTITSIDTELFNYCSSLQSIEIPDGVTTIGNAAFLDCTSLTTIELPESVTSIGSYAFSGCTNLTTVVAPGVTMVGDRAFANTNLSNFAIENLTQIGESAFEETNLSMDTITISSNCTYIGPRAFAFMRGSAKDIIIKDGLSYIPDECFCGSNINSINIPVTITEIGRNALWNTWVNTIYYQSGTREMWGQITFGYDWCGVNGETLVVTGDGDILLENPI